MIATYPVSKSHFESVDGFMVHVAEVDFPRRRHQRVVGADPSSRETLGKALLYKDTYPGRDETTYVYASHTATPQTFFPELNVFFQDLLAEGYKELSRKPFPVVFNLKGTPVQSERAVPLNASSKEIRNTKFFRMDLPFGPLTIEFGKALTQSLNESDLIGSGEIMRALGGPLIGCDFSLGSTYLPIFTRLHWARTFIGDSIMSSLTQQFAGEPAYA